MDLNLIPGMIKDICEKYNYPIPKLKYSDRMTKTLGRCERRNALITLNRKFCLMNSYEIIFDLLKHEIVHLKYKNHSNDFEDACRKMDISKHMHLDHPDVKYEVRKYKYQCPNCKNIFSFAKKLKTKRSCGVCSKKFNPNYILVLLEDKLISLDKLTRKELDLIDDSK